MAFNFGSLASSSGPSLFGGGGQATTFGSSAPGLSFGGQPAQPQSSATFFGAQPAPGGGLFGTSNPNGGSGGLFSSVQNPSSTGGLFGGSSGFGGFGSSSSFSGGSLFGGASSSGSLLGAPYSAAALGGGFNFGLSSQSLAGGAASGGLFGGASGVSFGASTGSGLFGASAPSLGGGFSFQSQSSSSFGGIGQSSSSSLLGANSPPSLFGSQPQSSGGLLGGGLSGFGGLGGSSIQPAAPGGTAIGAPVTALPRSLESIMESLNPQSPYCRFRHIFFNVVDPKDVMRYQCPPGTDERLWQQAQQNNPDPTRLVPVQATGFDDLKQRMSVQQTRIAQHHAVIESLEKALDEIIREHETVHLVKIMEQKRTWTRYVKRLVEISGRIDCYVAKGHHLTTAESTIISKIESLQRQINSAGQLNHRLIDLEERVQIYLSNRKQTGMGVEADDADVVQAIKSFLSDQLKGISCLHKDIELIERDMAIITNGIEAVRKT